MTNGQDTRAGAPRIRAWDRADRGRGPSGLLWVAIIVYPFSALRYPELLGWLCGCLLIAQVWRWIGAYSSGQVSGHDSARRQAVCAYCAVPWFMFLVAPEWATSRNGLTILFPVIAAAAVFERISPWLAPKRASQLWLSRFFFGAGGIWLAVALLPLACAVLAAANHGKVAPVYLATGVVSLALCWPSALLSRSFFRLAKAPPTATAGTAS